MGDVIIMRVEITLSEHMPYRNAHPEEREWVDEVIFKERLIVHSNEIGDEIGTMKILEIENE